MRTYHLEDSDHDLMSTELQCIFYNFSNLDMIDPHARALPYYAKAAFGLTSFYLLNVVLFSYSLHQYTFLRENKNMVM